MQGIALLASELPEEFLHREAITRRTHLRGDLREIRFFWHQTYPILPVLVDGEIRLVRWGNRDRKGKLPLTGYTWVQSIQEGKWTEMEPKPVVILASMGIENGVWYPIREGIQGILVRDELDQPRVYMVCKEPTRYYFVMTRAKMQPVLVGGESI